ncbi:putative membrane protein [Yersinia pseudotuberculosis IP 32953]|uniref:Uncharacterized protein n=8 Tax=Yersinia pseudotuberculosis complex TaxID=1649845 RepID=A0ABM7AJJ8_YERPU|nr:MULTISPECIES: hypothetical protein [Yersinia pseudotuberculosis complex]CQD56608.1 Uncharacterised protein [Yersinia intermedia]ABS46403.1 conserved hypothetical protein [Yersinia pseudotuberculosis IP 31758]AIN16266.1 putative membrane protein [Yersinia pseudotuberculosis]AJJ02209.1 putative membrane protein [Yersinia pseudotuberculosis]AJJ05500.1 putative membrane protein [Yersinia pseudotuberculosis]
MNLKSKIFIFWGMMDLYYIVRYIWVSLSVGKIPFVSDINNFLPMDFSDLLIYRVIVIGSMLTTISVLFTAFFFLKNKKIAIMAAFIQEPFRLIFGVYSISLIPTVINALGMTILVTNLFFLFISEGLKIYTLLIARKM